MCGLETFKIDLKALKEGLSSFAFDLEDAYFKAVNAPVVSKGHVHVDLDIVRAADDVFTLSFHEQGTVVVPCDLCLEDMDQEIDTRQSLTAKFGDEYSEDDDLVTVAENEGILDVAWFIYEFIELSIPIKHVHAPGKCNPAMIEKLQELSATRSGEDDGEHPVDPRWASLMKLKK